jgi:peptide/nickel transport system ATP-binding protein
MSLIEVYNLTKKFKVMKGVAGKKAEITAVNKVSFKIDKGKTLGLVGESGCGKTTTGRVVVKLAKPTSGKIIIDGKDVTFMNDTEFKPFRRNVQIIFQDPYSSLNPRMTIYDTLKRPLHIFKITKDKDEERELIRNTLASVGLKPEHMTRYPHEFSGGQRQRVAVARAIISHPNFIVLDEPTSALDVSVQAQIMNLLKELKNSLSLTYLFISHDLSVVKFISDKIAVMYLGNIVEMADTSEIFRNPLHPYTSLLFQSIPVPNPKMRKKIPQDTGELPSLLDPPKGCPFYSRCPLAKEECKYHKPRLVEVSPGHEVACFLHHDRVMEEEVEEKSLSRA